MAFIRWKPDGAGGRKAYLVHAYRGPDGKPKQRVLAYLGEASELTPDHIASLKAKHPDLDIDWEKIKKSEKPVIDVASLTDAELIKNLRALRLQNGLSIMRMAWRLQDAGVPRFTVRERGHLHHGNLGELEKALERGQARDYYLNPEVELAPTLRKVFAQPS